MKEKSFAAKAISVAASISMLVSAVPLVSNAERPVLGYMGDINHDNTVNAADLVSLANFLSGKGNIDENASYNADMNFDGKINSFDMVILRKYILGTRELDPIYGEEETTTTTTATTTTTTTTTTISETTTTTTGSANFIDASIKELDASLPSQGDAALVIFYVDFPDCQYSYAPSESEIEKIAFGPENASDSNYPFESCSAFFERSSKGEMDLTGKVFRYTTKENHSQYDNDKVKLTKECYEAFKDQVDFSDYDKDNDGYVDCTLFTVPSSADENYWWPCAGASGATNYTVDGVKVGHIITGNAQIQSSTNYTDFISSYCHEMGHCMGLPDYYLYQEVNGDYWGFHGSAGTELMDDALSDFGAFSKLVLGWYKEDQVSVYDTSMGTQTYTLNNAQTDNGNCVIIPYNNNLASGYKSEYFIIEYNSAGGNNANSAWWKGVKSGVRIFHISSEVSDNGWWKYYTYANGTEENPNGSDGRRLLRLVNDGNGPFTSGSVINSSTSGFGWYDSNGKETVAPGVTINVSQGSGDTYNITISAN